MKLTKESHKLMSFFIKYNCIKPIKQTKKTDAILRRLYYEIVDGVSYINEVKGKRGSLFYGLKLVDITSVSQIPKPSTFPPNSFPLEVRNHIDDFSLSMFSYTMYLFDRDINIMFLTEQGKPEDLIETYNTYVDYMLVWLYIVNEYSSKSCVKKLKIYVYHTSLLKELPRSNIEILGWNNVNTAFTRTCPKDSEIIVFRKEEWFKVFMHETIHNFGLDFSGMNQDFCNKKILSIFPVNSEVNLYESYTEFWARIMNALFCSYINIKNKLNIDDFLTNVELFINFERIFAFFQMIKVLDFMDISYKDLYQNTVESENIRKAMFKENTSVLSYYIITLIMLNGYQDFISWCNINNTSLLQFKKTSANLNEYCKFIEKKYKTRSLLDGIECMEKLLKRVSKKRSEMVYIIRNMRMTICELG